MADELLTIACKAICQSGKFETGEGGCAAICMSVLGSSRGGPHGCPHAEQIHGNMARDILYIIANFKAGEA